MPARGGSLPVERCPRQLFVEGAPHALALGSEAGGFERAYLVEPAAFRALCLYGWPLNVRELGSCVRRAAALTTDGVLRVEQLPAAVRETLIRGAPIAARRRSPRAAPERGELERLLRQHHGNVAHVARSLDRRWNVVWRWLVRHQLEPERFRE